MTFLDSVNTCLKKTLTISGRASRSEFWWFQLSFFVIGLIVGLIVAALGADSTLASIIGIIFALYVIVGSIASFTAGIRRLHDQIRLAGFGILAVRYDSICKLHLMDCLHCIYLSGRYSWR